MIAFCIIDRMKRPAFSLPPLLMQLLICCLVLKFGGREISAVTVLPSAVGLSFPDESCHHYDQARDCLFLNNTALVPPFFHWAERRSYITSRLSCIFSVLPHRFLPGHSSSCWHWLADRESDECYDSLTREARNGEFVCLPQIYILGPQRTATTGFCSLSPPQTQLNILFSDPHTSRKRVRACLCVILCINSLLKPLFCCRHELPTHSTPRDPTWAY